MTTSPDISSEPTPGPKKAAYWLKRSIRTLAALPDVDHRYIYGTGTAWPEYLPDSLIEGKDRVTKVKPFEPTPYDVSIYLDCLDWLTWLESVNAGKRDSRVISAHAMGVPWWKIAERYGRDIRTVQRWRDNAHALIYRYHRAMVDTLIDPHSPISGRTGENKTGLVSNHQTAHKTR